MADLQELFFYHKKWMLSNNNPYIFKQYINIPYHVSLSSPIICKNLIQKKL